MVHAAHQTVTQAHSGGLDPATRAAARLRE